MSGITDKFDKSDHKPTERPSQYQDKNAPYIPELQRLGRGRFSVVTELVNVLLFPPFVVHRLDGTLLLEVQDGAREFVSVRGIWIMFKANGEKYVLIP